MDAIQLQKLIENLKPKECLILLYEIGCEAKFIKLDYDNMHTKRTDGYPGNMLITATYEIENGWLHYTTNYMTDRRVYGINLNEIRGYEIIKN